MTLHSLLADEFGYVANQVYHAHLMNANKFIKDNSFLHEHERALAMDIFGQIWKRRRTKKPMPSSKQNRTKKQMPSSKNARAGTRAIIIQ